MFRWIQTAKFVDSLGRLTSESIRALSPSREPFKPVAIPTGAPSAVIDVTVQATDQGYFIIKNFGSLNTAVSITRGTTTLEVIASSPIPVNPGDVIKFTYTFDPLPAFQTKLFFSPL